VESLLIILLQISEYVGERIMKIGQYLAKIWTSGSGLLFLAHPVCTTFFTYLPNMFYYSHKNSPLRWI